MSGALGPKQRAAALTMLRRDPAVDVIVVGGGVTGAGAALDAATRGLSVALLEARDFAAGTSGRSSKLIHGGLRYLEQLNIGLVREALAERGLLLEDLAPHLVRPVPFLYPLTRRVWERLYVGAGLVAYDLLGGAGRGLPRHRHWSKATVRRVNPGLAPDSYVGGLHYYDAGVDDARHTLFLARTAAYHGAAVLTRAEVTALLTEGGTVVGARVRDHAGGDEFVLRARAVINATGPAAERVQTMAGPATVRMRPSKGVHIVVERSRVPLRTGLILRTATSVLFLVPWWRHWLIGTTDSDWAYDVDDPVAQRADVDYLLAQANRVLADPLTREDVVGVFAGVRPLIATVEEGARTATLSREHAVHETVPGLFTVAGGKYTTYRVMARDAVDAASARVPRGVPRSITEKVPLLGAPGYAARRQQRERLAEASGLPLPRIDRLTARYGDLVDDVLDAVACDPSLGRPLAGAGDYLRAEVAYAATHEGAMSLDDVLARRTHVQFETRDRGVSAATDTAAVLGEVLGWDADAQQAEVARYRRGVQAQLRAESATSDEAAVRAHRAAP